MKPVKWQRVSKILICCLLLTAAFFYRDSLAEIFQGIQQAEPAAVLMSAMLSMAAYFVEGMTIACMAGAVIPSGFCERDLPLPPRRRKCTVHPARAGNCEKITFHFAQNKSSCARRRNEAYWGTPSDDNAVHGDLGKLNGKNIFSQFPEALHENAGQKEGQAGPLSIRQGIRITFLCEFYRMITLGNGSGFAEIHYLHKNGMEAGSAAVLTMIQYMLKRTAVMLLGTFGFAVLWREGDTRAVCREYALFMAAGCGVTAGVILVFTALALSDRIASWAERLLEQLSRKLPSWEKRFSKWKEQIRLLNQSGKDFLKQKRRSLCALALQIVKMLLFYSIPASLLFGKTGISFAESILLMAVAYMLSGIIPAPSGAGALEFVFLLFFSHFTDSGRALSVILLFRFATWVLPFGIGGGLMAAGRRKEAKDNPIQNG